MIVLDTDHISALQYRDAPKAFALQARLSTFSPEEIATTAITIEEQMRGWLGAIHRHTDVHQQVAYYDRLVKLFDFFSEWLILPFDQRAADQFQALRNQGIRVGTMDLKIASIVLVHDATLLSENLRDFRQVAGLQVEDWLQS
ncbi:MAG: type II toxin-antitoxin system VapC family toxin [Deltaproteobacteria bacterium]|nr:type II toxin-antitoxin system VapC family toxin [Deltaproteobacteria bacterium]